MSRQRRPFRPQVESLEDRRTPATLAPGFTENLVAGGLSSPTALAVAPDGRVFVTEQAGNLRVIQNGVLQPTPFLSVAVSSTGERGLLGVTFDPDFANNQYVYVYYTTTVGGTHNRVSRFTANGNVAVPNSEFVLMDLEGLSATNHNGGAMHFGPDGKLYIATGENAVRSNAQTLNNRLGKILRINSDGSIPTDNPFYNSAAGANRSIYALGLRNPYTFAFQPGTGKLYVNDVGEATWEEINDVVAGANLGWPINEGAAGNPTYRDPIFQYGHTTGPNGGVAIVGASFYNPTTQVFPADYTGDFFFGEFASGWIRRYDQATGQVSMFATGIAGPVDLQVADDGSLYYLARFTGQLFRIQFTGLPTPANIQTLDDGQPNTALTPQWSYRTGEGQGNDIHYAAAGNGSRNFLWNFDVTPGIYRVAATWSANANRATNAPFTILQNGIALETVAINQELDPNDFSASGASYKYLGGSFAISGSKLSVSLSDLADEFVVADGIRIEKIGELSAGADIQVTEGSDILPDGVGNSSFGSTVANSSVSKTYTVRNLGLSPLTLGTIQVPSGFSVQTSFGVNPVPGGGSTTFTLRLDAVTAGTFSGAVHFTTGDADTPTFDFHVSGAVSQAAALIVDNGAAGFSSTGAWTARSGEGYLNDIHYAAAGNGSSTANWVLDVMPGIYRLAATWSPHPNRASNSPFTVLDGGVSLGVVPLDQRVAPNDFNDQGAAWERLGEFRVNGTSVSVRLTNQANNFVIADAIRFERVSDLPVGPEIELFLGSTSLVDDNSSVDFGSTPQLTPVLRTFTIRNFGSTDLSLSDAISTPTGFEVASTFGSTTVAPGASTTFSIRLAAQNPGTYSGALTFANNDGNENPFSFTIQGTVQALPAIRILDNGDSNFQVAGAWTAGGGEGYLSDIHYAAAGQGSSIATWNFNVTPGIYRVAATWSTFTNRASNAAFQVFDGSQLRATTVVDQRAAPNDFSDAGASWETLGNVSIAGNGLTVRLSNLANNFVIADGMRIERTGDLPVESDVQVFDGAADIPHNTGAVAFGNTAQGSPVLKTFTVRNSGSSNLTLFSPIAVPNGFSVHQSFGVLSLAPGDSTNFILRLDAANGGTYSGNVSFSTNDPDENPFVFQVNGGVAVQIIDNGAAGFQVSSGWTAGAGEGYQNDIHYAAAGNGSRNASWNFTVTPGRYRVAATWSAHSNRATNSPFRVLDTANILGSIAVNQQLAPNDFASDGAPWEVLGIFNVSSNSLVVQLSNLATNFVIADAIRIERSGDLLVEPDVQVLDGAVNISHNSGAVSFGNTPQGVSVLKTFTVRNTGNDTLTLFEPITVPTGFSVHSSFTSTSLAAGASASFVLRLDAASVGTYSGIASFASNDLDKSPFQFGVVGGVGVQVLDNGSSGFSVNSGWIHFFNEGYLNDMHYRAAGNGSSIATWAFSAVPGQYRVAATWSTDPNRATNSPFRVLDGNNPLASIAVNQQLAPNDFAADGAVWEVLGVVDISSNSLVVQLSNLANGFVIADAIRIEKMG